MDSAVNLSGMAEILNVSVDTVRRKAIAGDIPGMKIGTLWRFNPAAVMAHLTAASDPWKRAA